MSAHADDPFQSQGGSAEVQIGDDRGSYQFQYGSVGDLNQTPPADLEQLGEAAKTILNESGDNDHAVMVFEEEGHPADVPTQISNKVPIIRLSVPSKICEFFRQKVAVTRSLYSKPSPQDWVMGMLWAFPIKVGMTSFIWLSDSRVSSEVALRYIAAMAVFTIAHNVFNQSYNNFYNYNVINPERSWINKDKLWRWTKNTLYDFAVSAAFWELAGHRNTLTQLAITNVISFFTSTLIASERDVLLKNKRYLAVAYSAVVLPISAIIGAIDAKGHLPVWIDLQVFEFRPTTFATLLVAATMYTLITKKPDWTIKRLEQVESVIQRVTSWVTSQGQRVLGGFKSGWKTCDHLLRRNRDDSENQDRIDGTETGMLLIPDFVHA